MKKISCIIPAYNEEKEIGKILSVVIPLIGQHLHEVIVVDDGSKDNTKKIAKEFSQINFIEHTENKGKSATVADGIKASTGDYIFLLDADLQSLDAQNIIDLINPIENDVSSVSISFRKNSWPLFPFKTIDYLSGERILPKTFLMEKIEKMSMLPSYGLEVFINRIIIKNKLTIKIVQWPNVENNLKQNSLKKVIKIWWNILCTISIFEMYSQNIKMLKLIKRD